MPGRSAWPPRSSAQLLGAAVVIVGDLNEERLANARRIGCETVDVSKGDPKDQIEQILGVPEVDCAVDAVGFEARGHGSDASHEAPATVLNSIMDLTAAGGALGIPGLYVTGDPGAVDDAAKVGSLSIRLGLGWAKSLSFTTGQCPVMKYHRGLMNAILHDKVHIGDAVERHRDRARRGAAGLRGLRLRRGQEVRHRPAQLHRQGQGGLTRPGSDDRGGSARQSARIRPDPEQGRAGRQRRRVGRGASIGRDCLLRGDFGAASDSPPIASRRSSAV